MKPFNIEEAKAGKPVCTRGGADVRILCFDRKNEDGESIVALIKCSDGEEYVRTYTSEGVDFVYLNENDNLRMKTRTQTGWVNLYRMNHGAVITGNVLFSKEEAYRSISAIPDGNFIATTEITWEE